MDTVQMLVSATLKQKNLWIHQVGLSGWTATTERCAAAEWKRLERRGNVVEDQAHPWDVILANRGSDGHRILWVAGKV